MTTNKHTQNTLQVLLVIHHPVGGIKSYIKYVYKTPWFDNHHFTVILPWSNQPSDLFIDSNIHVEYIPCEHTTGSMTWTVFQALRKHRCDLVHSHGFTSGVCAAMPARIYEVPHILTSHDVLLEKQFRGVKGQLKKYALPYFLNRADLIHSVSYDAERNLIDMLPAVNHKKLVTIPNGIDVSVYENVPARDFYAELSLSDNCFLLGFLGRFMSQKGFRYLIDAVEILNKQQDLPQHPLILTFGYGGFIREDREIITAKGLESSFQFMPGVDNVAAALKGLDAVAMPSLWEASGLLAMEALVSGVPLIASNCMGLREVTAGSPAFVVEPENAESLALAIRDCIFDDRREEFEAYIPEAKNRFDSSRTSEQLQQLYTKIAK